MIKLVALAEHTRIGFIQLDFELCRFRDMMLLKIPVRYLNFLPETSIER